MSAKRYLLRKDFGEQLLRGVDIDSVNDSRGPMPITLPTVCAMI